MTYCVKANSRPATRVLSCNLGWQAHSSTFADGLSPFPSFKHAKTCENLIKVYLGESENSLGSEFFLADAEEISTVWEEPKLAEKEIV